MAARSILLLTIGLLGVNAIQNKLIQPRDAVSDEAKMTTPELLQKHGYPVETHQVTTEDGYILTMHRVPYSPRSPLGDTKKTPIFLQHGLISSSADWVVMGPGISYAYVLADAGYDVWMGNSRGNKYSKQHTTLDVDTDEFWSFSWHENGIYDLPAEIDYVLQATGEEKLFYAGHSMGTTMFFVMATEKPEYNDKIRAMFAFAPIVYMNHMTSPFFKIFSLSEPVVSVVVKVLGVKEFLPNSYIMELGGQLLCQDGAITQDVCSNVLFLITGYDSQELNETMLPSIFAHCPAGASTKQFLHYAQEINSGHFRQYDHGSVVNLVKYGKLNPPDYDLSQVTAPVHLHYGDNDWLAGLEDVERLYEGLTNSDVTKHEVANTAFNHQDFMWAVDVNELVYSITLDTMKNY